MASDRIQKEDGYRDGDGRGPTDSGRWHRKYSLYKYKGGGQRDDEQSLYKKEAKNCINCEYNIYTKIPDVRYEQSKGHRKLSEDTDDSDQQ